MLGTLLKAIAQLLCFLMATKREISYTMRRDHFMKAAFFLFLAVTYSFAIFATTAAQELTQTFVAPEGYIIKLPPGWIEAGKDELAALEKLVLEGAPNAKLGAPRNQLVHLYRQDTDTNLFGDPRIMVAFCRVGKLPEEVFKDLYAIKAQTFTDSALKSNVWNASAKVGAQVYDEKRHFLSVPSSYQTEGTELRVIQAIFLTEVGTLTFQISSSANKHELYAAIWDSIIKNINIHESIEYNSRLAVPQIADWKTKLLAKIIVGIVTAIFGLYFFSSLIRKGKHKIKEQQPASSANENQLVFMNCDCKVCGNPIEYPKTASGQVVQCPHCQADTRLGT